MKRIALLLGLVSSVLSVGCCGGPGNCRPMAANYSNYAPTAYAAPTAYSTASYTPSFQSVAPMATASNCNCATN